MTTNVIRIEVGAENPDAWAFELSLRMTRAELAITPRWRILRRRELLASIGILEDKLRTIAAERDAAALERTRKLVTDGEP